MTGGQPGAARILLLGGLAHLAPVLWLFRGVVFSGEVPYFRDISVYYYPNYVFLARSAAQGTWWPLWNPTSDAGAPFLVAYPLDLLSVWLLGAEAALRLGPPLHVWLAMLGATVLAARLGTGAWGAWAAGLFYGLSGYVLSTANLFELCHGVAWAPWVVAALLAFLDAPTARRAGWLVLAAGVQISTLAAETVLQAGLLALVLARGRSLARAFPRLAAAGALLALLALPVAFGVGALVEGTRRSQGFESAESFAWSATPAVLLDAILPGFFGDPHSFTGRGYWGEAFFPDGFPYLLSLYLGVPVLLLASHAGGSHRRLWLLVAAGVLLALGSHGPLEAVMRPFMRSLRVPVKFFLLATLPLCLLAGLGLERVRRRERVPRLWTLAPGLGLLAAALVCLQRPELAGRLAGTVLPELAAPGALEVVSRAWPAALGSTGAMALGAALVLRATPRWAWLAALLSGFDLLAVNGAINTSAPADFYRLRPAMAGLVAQAAAAGRHRWFSYGAAHSPGLGWRPETARGESDVWLYYVDRQSLLPRTHVLDGLEAAFDEDRVGWSPEGATLTGVQRQPALFAAHRFSLRLAGVRWVLSFLPLPGALATRWGEVAFPEIVVPLGFYELPDWLPRAFAVTRHEVAGGPEAGRRVRSGDFDPRELVLLDEEPPQGAAPAGGGSVSAVFYEAPDPHTVRLRLTGPSAWVVVLDGHHPGWRAWNGARPIPVLRAYGRYRALPVPEGARSLVMRYAPGWVHPSLAGCGLALLATLVLLLRRPTLDSPGGSR